jgi:hypothetical protein
VLAGRLAGRLAVQSLALAAKLAMNL